MKIQKPTFVPSVMVLREKHDFIYYAVPTRAAFYRTALRVLQQRLQDGTIENPEDMRPKSLGVSNTFEDQHGVAFDSMAGEALREARKAYQEAWKEWTAIKKNWDDSQRAIADQNGKLAWACLQRRDDLGFEYEGVHLSPLRVVS